MGSPSGYMELFRVSCRNLSLYLLIRLSSSLTISGFLSISFSPFSLRLFLFLHTALSFPLLCDLITSLSPPPSSPSTTSQLALHLRPLNSFPLDLS